MKINVNGSNIFVLDTTLSYDKIVELAQHLGYKRKGLFTIMVCYKPGKEYSRNNRTVHPSETCVVEENMIINALITDNA